MNSMSYDPWEFDNCVEVEDKIDNERIAERLSDSLDVYFLGLTHFSFRESLKDALFKSITDHYLEFYYYNGLEETIKEMLKNV